MNTMASNATYVIEEISPEHFIGEHYFMYVVKGVVVLYDGCQYMELHAGQCCIARKNRLGRYYKMRENGELEKVILALDEPLLKRYQQKHNVTVAPFAPQDTCIAVDNNALLTSYIASLRPYYDRGQIATPFSDLKREELLLILLQSQPALAGLLFDYGIPAKINLEEFMNRNYTFNVSMERFAFLTGRSLSAFKRDFRQVFNDAPNHWLVQRRLQEAHFLIEKEKKKPSEIYLDLGFETLSHFSHTFKKRFGYPPSDLR